MRYQKHSFDNVKKYNSFTFAKIEIVVHLVKRIP